MKILFVCGCLEPGRDGVGDYTRRLAGELVRQGNDCRMVALNDPFVDQSHGCLEELTMRFPRTSSWVKRMTEASDWIGDFKPDWISLQFVAYSFQSRGLSLSLGAHLKRLAPAAKWHVMMHELWIGMERDARLRARLEGHMQCFLIKRMLRRIAPLGISTQSRFYLEILAQHGIEAKQLELFGNIPANRSAGGIRNVVKDRFRFVLFGGIHPGSNVNRLTIEIARWAKIHNLEAELVIVGRCGAEQPKWVEAWAAAGLNILEMGEQPASVISSVMATASAGIATTPLTLIGKSGSVAAMLEHGLPVICVSPLWKPRHRWSEKIPSYIIDYETEGLHSLLELVGNVPPSSGVEMTAKCLISQLLEDK